MIGRPLASNALNASLWGRFFGVGPGRSGASLDSSFFSKAFNLSLNDTFTSVFSFESSLQIEHGLHYQSMLGLHRCWKFQHVTMSKHESSLKKISIV